MAATLESVTGMREPEADHAACVAMADQHPDASVGIPTPFRRIVATRRPSSAQRREDGVNESTVAKRAIVTSNLSSPHLLITRIQGSQPSASSPPKGRWQAAVSTRRASTDVRSHTTLSPAANASAATAVAMDGWLRRSASTFNSRGT